MPALLAIFSCDIMAAANTPERAAIEAKLRDELQKPGREARHPISNSWLLRFNDGDRDEFLAEMTALRDQHPNGFRYTAIGWDPATCAVVVSPARQITVFDTLDLDDVD